MLDSSRIWATVILGAAFITTLLERAEIKNVKINHFFFMNTSCHQFEQLTSLKNISTLSELKIGFLIGKITHNITAFTSPAALIKYFKLFLISDSTAPRTGLEKKKALEKLAFTRSLELN